MNISDSMRMTSEEGIALGAKSEVFGKILRENVFVPKRLKRGSKCLVKVTRQLVVEKETTMTFREEKRTIEQLRF